METTKFLLIFSNNDLIVLRKKFNLPLAHALWANFAILVGLSQGTNINKNFGFFKLLILFKANFYAFRNQPKANFYFILIEPNKFTIL